MTAEEKFNKAIQWVLNELQAEMLVSGPDPLRFTFVQGEDAPLEREQKRVVRWLINLGAVEHIADIQPETSLFTFNPFVRVPPIGYKIKINVSVFTALAKIYEGDLRNKSAGDFLKEAEVLAKAKPLKRNVAVKPKTDNRPFLNEEERTIIFLGKKSEIPVGNQWVLCQALFKKPAGVWVEEADVVDHFNRDSKQAFYDAQRLLNTRIEKDLGIKDFIEYQGATARINPKTIEKLSHSEK